MKKYGLDTNVVIRMLVDDNPVQRRAALEFAAGLDRNHLGHVTLVTILELDWALRSRFGYGKDKSAAAIKKLLDVRGLEVEAADIVQQALKLVKDQNADFADALIACKSLAAGCDAIKTFDIKAVRKVPGMELIA